VVVRENSDGDDEWLGADLHRNAVLNAGHVRSLSCSDWSRVFRVLFVAGNCRVAASSADGRHIRA
jgi:hypothetical protein